jgi:hypothetical protein
MLKITEEWKRRLPKGAKLSEKQLLSIREILVMSPHDDGLLPVTVVTDKGDSTHLVPFEKIILDGLSGKEALQFPLKEG